MPDGSVHGSFDFDASGAIASMRSLRGEGRQVDQQLRRLGSTADEVSGKVDRAFGKMATAVGTQTDRINKSVDSSIAKVREFGAMDEKATIGVEGVTEAKQDIKSLGDDVRDFGKLRESAHVEITGLAAANAELSALEARLRKFSHERATATARIRTTGGVPNVPAIAARAAAGGGGGGSGLRAPPMGLLGLGGVALLPAIQALGGTAIGVGGSAAAGATAAGVVGGAGLGTLGVGLAPSFAIAKDFEKDLKKAEKAQQAYNTAVAEYGVASKQAETAKKKLDLAYSQNPGTQRAIAEMHALNQATERQITRPGTRALGTALGVTLGRVRRQALPMLAPGARQDIRATAAEGTRLGGFLTAPNGPVMNTAIAMQAEFARDLPIMERSLENVLTVMSNVARVSLPFFHEANLWIEHQTRGWAQWSGDTARVQTTMDHGVESFKRWRDLAGATFRIVRDLFSAGRPTGDSVITDLTKRLDHWDQWIRANPQRIQTFFRDAWSATKNIASAVWEIAKALGQVSNLLLPVLSQFAKLAGLAGGAGLLLPLALRGGLGYVLGRRDPGVAAILGGRGAMGMGALRGAQAAGGGVLPIMGGTRAGGGAVVGGAIGRAPTAYELAQGRTFGGTFLMPAAPGDMVAVRQAQAAAARNAAAAEQSMMSRLTSAARAAPSALGGAALLPFGMGRFSAAEGSNLIGRLGAGRLAMGARSIAGFAGPLMAISGLLGAATTPGTAYERFTGGLSAATLGLIPAEGTRAQLMGKGAQGAQAYYSRLTPGMGVGPEQARVGALQREIARQQRLLPSSVAGALEQPIFGKGLPITSEVKGHIKALRTLLISEQKQLRRDLDVQAVQTADDYMTHIGTAWQREARTKGPIKATKDMNKGILAEMHTLRNAGKVSLGDSALAWEHELARHDPRLKKQYTDLRKAIVAEFDAMGKHVKIVNDQILTGSQTEWINISNAISGPARVAAEKAIGSFQLIQKQAIGSLEAMGFTKIQASKLVQEVETGKVSNAAIGKQITPTSVAATAALTPRSGRATGGRIGGVGLMDTVKVADGGKAAPGELIVNRHTERDVNRDLIQAGKPSLEARVTQEKRPHSAPPAGLKPDHDIMPGLALGGRIGQLIQFFATGGRPGGGAPTGGGGSQLQTMIDKASEIASHNYAYSWGGGHNPSFSPPYDCSGAVSAVLHAGGLLNSPLVASNFMTFGQPGGGDVGIYANPGHVYMTLKGRGWGTAGANPGGGANWIAGRTGALPGFTTRHVNASGAGVFGGAGAGGMAIALHGIDIGMKGVEGAMGNRASAIHARGLQDQINRAIGSMTPGGGSFHGTLSGSAEQQIAQFFGSSGMNKIAIAGLIGNAVQESGLNWGAAGGGMWQQISNFGSGAPSPMVQMQTMLGQIRGSGVLAQMNAASSPAQAADIFERGFEKAGIPNNPRREAAAQAAFAAGFSRGGRIPSWLGWFDRGTDFTTRPGRPVMFGAGERQAERVRIERTAPSANRGGGGGRGGHQIKIEFHGTQIGSQMDLEQVGEHVARKLIEAIEAGETTDSALA